MSEEEYQKLTELLKQKSAEIMAIEDRYILEDGNLIEIGEMPPEVLRWHFELKKMGDCSFLTLDRNIDISKELEMLSDYGRETARKMTAKQIREFFKEILGYDQN